MVWLVDPGYGALSGNHLFVHNNCTRQLLNISNTFGLVRNANLSKSRRSHVMLIIRTGPPLLHINYGGLDVNN